MVDPAEDMVIRRELDMLKAYKPTTVEWHDAY
jgi:hypothetical protein